MHISHGEEKILNILQNNNISYETQKTFNDCKSSKGWPFKFDFYLPDYNCCIEYDGEQHFHAKQNGPYTEKYFKEIKKNDEAKDLYCQEKGILLIRIPYTDYSKLTFNYLKERINQICDMPN